MKKLLLSLLLISLFSYISVAGAAEHNKLIDGEYAEGKVIVVMDAPVASNYSIMGTFNKESYSRAVSNQAEGFARSFGLEALNTFPEIAEISECRRSGIILQDTTQYTSRL